MWREKCATSTVSTAPPPMPQIPPVWGITHFRGRTTTWAGSGRVPNGNGPLPRSSCGPNAGHVKPPVGKLCATAACQPAKASGNDDLPKPKPHLQRGLRRLPQTPRICPTPPRRHPPRHPRKALHSHPPAARTSRNRRAIRANHRGCNCPKETSMIALETAIIYGLIITAAAAACWFLRH